MAKTMGDQVSTNGSSEEGNSNGTARVGDSDSLSSKGAPTTMAAPEVVVAADAVTTGELERAVQDLRNQIDKATKRSWFSWLWGSFKYIVVLVLLAGAAVGAYFGWEYYKDEVRDPIDANAAVLSGADGGRISTVEERLSNIDASIATLDDRVTSLDTTAAESLPGQISELADRTTELEAAQGTVQELVDSHSEQLDELVAIQQQLDAATAAQFDATKATALLSRARLFLYQANYGLAAEDLAATAGLVAGIEPTDALTAAELTNVTDRIDRALAALPDRPVIAADEVDIAWSVFVGDSPLAAADIDAATGDDAEATTDAGTATETETSQAPTDG